MAIKTVQATINGQTYTLTLNSTSGKYEATVTAPSKSSYNQSGHYYGVTVKATDVAGNITTKDAADATLGKSLRLQVKEKVAPIIAITAPTVGTYLTNNKPTITWKVTDADSGVNPATIGITIDSETKITGDSIAKTAITEGYQCTYTPTTALSDGSHTIKLDASDYDGNAAATSSTSFKVDTVPPVLTLSSPTDKLVTNQSACTVKGTTNDATSSPVTVTVKLNSGAAEAVTVKLNSGAAEAVTVGSDGRFSKALTLAEGTNTIIVVAKDGAGKTTTVTRTVTLNTVAPTIKSVTITPNPVDCGKTFVISVEVTN